MALSKKPITGMKDILPEEMEIRDYVIGVIKETYRNFGFTSIETPCVENLANLNCKAGGENEKLIFKILKRGEKLRLQEAHGEDDLVDGGLRYDLTVPLVRYYANHANELPAPLRHCRSVMSGVRTGLSAAAIVSLCSAISTFWGKRVIWRRSS
jgi:histidyl-tRNA synthetase